MLIILFLTFIGTIFYGVTSLMSDSQAYTDAMELARTNEKVIKTLGTPIEQNGIVGGNVQYSSGYSEARINIPIEGPRGKATIRVEGGGADEVWSYEKMSVFVAESGEIIDLLERKVSNDSLQ